MPDLLIEFFSEEIPARMQAGAAAEVSRLAEGALAEVGLALDSHETHVTPRRLVLMAYGLPARSPDRIEERRGPRVGAPEAALQGFLRGLGRDSTDGLEQRDTGKGAFWFTTVATPGTETITLLPGVIRAIADGLPWPTSMRFAGGTRRWVRPLRSILALFDGQPVPGALPRGGTEPDLPFGDTTEGHRFLAPGRFRVSSVAHYKQELSARKVFLDSGERGLFIQLEIEKLLTGRQFRVRPDPELLKEVTGLVEWPVPLLGTIDADYMDLPPEVRRATMRANQKYFTVEHDDGRPAPHFIVVANIAARDGGAAIIAGNERVLRARLADARFFYDQDRARTLEALLPGLARVTFHERLGTQAARVERLEALAAHLAPACGADPALAARAARLAKADLVSGMVGEFPELQGLMGGYYARAHGEKGAVADAIAQHYRPAGASDSVPTGPVAVATSLADRIDTLTGFFAIDERPTGSKDPFALRRAALGLIRTLLETGTRLPLRPAFAAAWRLLAAQGVAGSDPTADLLAFCGDRLAVALREGGARHDLVAAVFAMGDDDLVRVSARVTALGAFLAGTDGANLLTAYRRAVNIVRIEDKKDGPHTGPVDSARLVLAAERTLATALDAAEGAARAALADERFAEAMAALATLRAPVDAFFDGVTVNAPEPDLRANRLRLLARIRAVMDGVASFQLVEG